MNVVAPILGLAIAIAIVVAIAYVMVFRGGHDDGHDPVEHGDGEDPLVLDVEAFLRDNPPDDGDVR